MRLYSYIVARDYGFAPNPFFGVCTLATCKPGIRGHARLGDWIIGTGGADYGLTGYLVYVMRVDEILSFDDYWSDPRYLQKRPNLKGCIMQAYGDNIYHRNPNGDRWMQEDSHHSFPGGKPNPKNVKNDTSAPRVLIGYRFIYWGGSGPKIPNKFRNHAGVDICLKRQGYRYNWPALLVRGFLDWVHSLEESGCVGKPKEFEWMAEKH